MDTMENLHPTVDCQGEMERKWQIMQQTTGASAEILAVLLWQRAIKMAESNACMKRIVAAPTAGSCGIVPAVLITYERMTNTSENDMVKALFVAAGIGDVIARRASISGAKRRMSGRNRLIFSNGSRCARMAEKAAAAI